MAFFIFVKRAFFIIIGLFTLFSCNSTEQDVITFLGIPVDGSVEEMRSKLQGKGFADVNNRISKPLLFEGTLNGVEVRIQIVSKNDLVCRIIVYEKESRNSVSIKNRFNTLCKQFDQNENYIRFETNDTIAAGVDISHGFFEKQERYVAQYFQKNLKGAGSKFLHGKVWFEIQNFKDTFHITLYYDKN